MCTPTQILLFCSCKNKSNTTKSLKNYTWQLYKYLGNYSPNEILIEGMMILPSKQLSTTLTNETILEALQLDTCFDFAYSAQEGDNLVIRNNVTSEYLSFIFTNNQWQADFYNCFLEKTEVLDKGVLHINTEH